MDGQSEFNMAVSFLGRLDNLFYLADAASMQSEAKEWFMVLRVLKRELNNYARDTDTQEALNKVIEEIEPMIITFNRSAAKGSLIMLPELYNALSKFEEMLRKILKDSGLETKMVTSAAKALTGGF